MAGRWTKAGQLTFGLAAHVLISGGFAQSAFADWKPSRSVEIVVPSGAGGGNDETARTLQQIWQKNDMLRDVVVVNKPGGGGAVSYAYTHSKPGNGHYISVARTGLLSNEIIGRSPITFSDMTPIAMVRDEAHALAVRADSPIQSMGDLITKLKADPQSVSIALGSSRGSTTEFLVAKLANSAGIDPKKLKVVTFEGGNTSVINLLGGHVDMVALGLGNLIEFQKAGKLRIIGLATPERSDQLPDVPTIREQGINVIQGGWFAIVGPPNMSADQVAYWEAMIEKATKDPIWTKLLESSYDRYWFEGSTKAKEFMRKDYDEVKALLTELGMIEK